MEDSGKHSSNTKFLNPWMLQFQKMGLELKCPLCLNLFRRPMLLPCNHIFCSPCIADCSRPTLECAVCNTHYAQRDLRLLPIVENMVGIYKSLDAAFYANLSQHRTPDKLPVLGQGETLLNATFNYKMSKEPSKTSLEDNLHRGQSVFSQTMVECVKDPFSSDHSIEVDIGRNHKYEKSGNVVNGKDEIFEVSCKGDLMMKCSQLDGRAHEDGLVEMDINQVTQSSLGSPPFCDTKGSDNDCSDRDSEHRMGAERLESSSSKRASKENEMLEKRVQLRSESSASETEGLVRDPKRPKNLSHDNDGIQPNLTRQSKLLTSECDMDLKAGVDLDSCSNTSICSFCQSFRTSEVTGPMLHYNKNGNSVMGVAALQPNVIHVHKLCIEWSPQVYFVEETVKNLKAEVARGAKLKCSTCGLKGAALGCYVRSCRRTYHVPCAMEISTCRWDNEEYLMLCPAHSHVKFPHEKSRSKKQSSQKHPVRSHLESKPSKPPTVLSDDSKRLIFCGSALSTDEKIHLINFASKIGATVTKFWSPDVTHVIAATDPNGACARTLKVLMGILNGQWILKMAWVTASMEVMRPVEEEPFEISLDNYGCQGGPKAGRLRTLANAPKLFSGFSMYFSGDYMSDYKEDLVDLVVAGGGTVLGSKEELQTEGHVCKETSKLIVYNLDPPHGSRLGDEVTILWERLNEAEDLAAITGSQVVGHTWVLESIAACKLQPFIS